PNCEDLAALGYYLALTNFPPLSPLFLTGVPFPPLAPRPPLLSALLRGRTTKAALLRPRPLRSLLEVSCGRLRRRPGRVAGLDGAIRRPAVRRVGRPRIDLAARSGATLLEVCYPEWVARFPAHLGSTERCQSAVYHRMLETLRTSPGPEAA